MREISNKIKIDPANGLIICTDWKHFAVRNFKSDYRVAQQYCPGRNSWYFTFCLYPGLDLPITQPVFARTTLLGHTVQNMRANLHFAVHLRNDHALPFHRPWHCEKIRNCLLWNIILKVAMKHIKISRSRNKIVEPKLLPNNKCNALRIVSWVRFVCFLGEVTARQLCFEINWPLVVNWSWWK